MLTPKQDKFAKNIALEGMNYSDAYRSSYSVKRMSDKTINDEASKLMNNPDITQRIAELRAELDGKGIMTVQKRLEWLTEVIQSEDEKTDTKLKAVDIMNKMQGEYVQKVRAEVTNAVNICIELTDDE
ncbi:MAG: terminase small subunit [Candidatus Heteroscillospira sp.]